MSELAGRVIIVTGGETGIGRAAAQAAVAAGAAVVVAGILEAEGEAAALSLREAGGRAEFRRVDVRSSAEVDALVDGVVKSHGRIDGLVCSAGVFDGFASGIDTTDGLWDHIMDVNARGTFFACRAALRHMVKAGQGRIVNVASIGGLVGMADGASYTASKHAVVGLTRHLGCYYAKDGVTVNAVCPGAIETGIRANSARLLGADAPPMGGVGASQDWVRTAIPMQRKGHVDEIAGLIGFLLSDKASYVTGACFTADGGWTAK